MKISSPAAPKCFELMTASSHIRRWVGACGKKAMSLVAESGIAPNEISVIGLILVSANCAAYIWYRNAFWLGTGLAISFAFDSLDGAVARYQGTQSAYGGYLDAVIDRYEEIITYFVIAWVNGWWAICFIAMTGSLLTSYNKARTAIEIPIDNKAWSDILDRPVRMWILCAGLILDPIISMPTQIGGRLIWIVLVALGPLTHITAAQRFLRARRILLSTDKSALHR